MFPQNSSPTAPQRCLFKETLFKITDTYGSISLKIRSSSVYHLSDGSKECALRVYGDMIQRFLKLLTHRRWMPAVILIGMLLLLGAFGVGFLMDDHLHRLMLDSAPDMACAQVAPWDLYVLIPENTDFMRRAETLGTAVWWRAREFQISFMRPLSSLSLYLDHVLFPGNAVWAHTVSLLWTLLLFLAVARLYRRLDGGPVAGLALLMFVLDDGHVFPAVWIANRNALIAGLFAVEALLLHHRSRADGSKSAAFAAPLCLAVALCAGEISLGILGFLFSYALFLDPAGRRKGLLSLLPHLAVISVWRTAYNLLGYGTYGADLYLDPLQNPAAFAVAALERMPILLAAHFGYLPAETHTLLLAPVRPYFLAGAVLWLLLAGVALYPLIKTSASARFWCVGTLAATVPCAATFPANRLMLIAGIGGTALLALLVYGFLAGTLPVRHRKLTATFVGITVLIQIAVAPFMTCTAVNLLKNINGLTETAARSLTDAVPGPIPEKTVVMLVAPDMFTSAFVPFWRRALNLPVPKRVEASVNSVSPVEILRENDTALRLTVQDGHFGAWTHPLTRKASVPMPPGHTVRQPGILYEVLTATPDCEPIAVRMTFDRPLGDPSLAFVVWGNNGYEPFALPEIGDTATVDIDEWTVVRALIQ